MEEKINNAKLSFTCNQDWNSMKSEDDGRFCDTCKKKVYDMTDKNAAYFIKIMQENSDKVCGRFSNEQLASSESVNKPYWKRWGVATMVFLGIGTVGQKANAQIKLGEVVVPKRVDSICNNDRSFIMGKVAMIPKSDELKILHEYLARKCKAPTSTNGWLVASFVVKKDGSLTNLATSDQLSKAVREEVLKTLKKAPKWDRTKIRYEQSYTLSLNFKGGKIMPNLNM